MVLDSIELTQFKSNYTTILEKIHSAQTTRVYQQNQEKVQEEVQENYLQTSVSNYKASLHEIQTSLLSPPLLQNPVKLIAVTKGRSIAEIEMAISLGISEFAENYLQEALPKWKFLKIKYPKLTLHFIGKLQSNKVKSALELFDVFHTVDREKLAVTLAKNPVAVHKKFLIQVNLENIKQENNSQQSTPIGVERVIEGKAIVKNKAGIDSGEIPVNQAKVNGKNVLRIGEIVQTEEMLGIGERAGVLLANLATLLNKCRAINLEISGLMVVLPHFKAINQGVDKLETNRVKVTNLLASPSDYFSKMYFLQQQYQLAELSMGMSKDFIEAIKCGSTMIRIGRDLFLRK